MSRLSYALPNISSSWAIGSRVPAGTNGRIVAASASNRLPQIDGSNNRKDGKPLRWDNGRVSLGIYISVPFCKTKCSYCNFASDVFSRAVFARYVDRVCGDIQSARNTAAEMGGHLEAEVDSIYLGGGTP